MGNAGFQTQRSNWALTLRPTGFKTRIFPTNFSETHHVTDKEETKHITNA